MEQRPLTGIAGRAIFAIAVTVAVAVGAYLVIVWLSGAHP
jgi:hypothetical protein